MKGLTLAFAIPVAATLLLGACRSAPPESAPVAGALALARSVPGGPATGEVPEPPPLPDPASLRTLLDLARTRNESIVQASQGIAIARAQADGVFGGAFLPRLAVSAGATTLHPVPGLETPLGALPFQDEDSARWSFELRVPLFHAAEALYLWDAAALGEDVARLGMLRTEQQIRSVVTQAFFRRLNLERQREVLREFLRSLESQADETRARVEAGAAIENDVLKIQLELNKQQQALVEIDNAIEMAAMQLNTCLALPRDTTYGIAWDEEFAEMALPPPADLVSRAEELRPDLRAQEVALRQLELQRKGELARFAPSLDAFASWTYTDTELYDTKQVSTLGLSLTWDVFDGGVRNHRATEALHRQRQIASGLREARRSVALEVEGSLRELENQASAVSLGRTAVAQATENLRVQRALYRNSRSTANDLLEAELQLTRARNSVIQATYAYRIALGQLEAAVGVEKLEPAPPARETPESPVEGGE